MLNSPTSAPGLDRGCKLGMGRGGSMRAQQTQAAGVRMHWAAAACQVQAAAGHGTQHTKRTAGSLPGQATPSLRMMRR